MTMVMVLGNRDQVIQVADRRLTYDGNVLDEESGKSGAIFFADGRFTFGFTGIARSLGVEVRRWILDSLYDSGPPDFTAYKTLERFRVRASKDFLALDCFRRLSARDRRLSVVFIGYLYLHDPPMIGCSVISNWQNYRDAVGSTEAWDEFFSWYTSEKTPRTDEVSFIERIGATGAMRQEDVDELRLLLDQRKPSKAIIDKSIDTMLKMADRPAASGTIGKQITWIRIPSDITQSVENGYYSNVPSHATFMPSAIWLGQDGRTAMDWGIVEAVDPSTTPPLNIPRVPQNARCPCGSGKKYKKCHGR